MPATQRSLFSTAEGCERGKRRTKISKLDYRTLPLCRDNNDLIFRHSLRESSFLELLGEMLRCCGDQDEKRREREYQPNL
jgi:hypothetical protein